MRIIGVDVGGAYSTAFLLDELPTDLKAFVNSREFKPFKIEHTRADLQNLLDLKPDWIIFEPTGWHYEQLLIQWCDRQGQAWKRVVGTRMAAHRKSLGLGKTDGHDSLAIAHYGWVNLDKQGAFCDVCELSALRRLWIERDTLIRMRIDAINRLRQLLKWQFPEVADLDLDRKWGEPTPAIVRWIAGDDTLAIQFRSRYRRMHDTGRWKNKNRCWVEGIGTIGSGVDRFAKFLANEILSIDRQNQESEQAMQAILEEDRFSRYTEAMNSLGFSLNVQTIWLSRIYPFDRFLVDGRPERIKRLSRTGKWVTQHVSLGQFKAALGAGTIPNTSGIRGEVKTRYYHRRKMGEAESMPMGDKLARRAFVVWGSKVLEMGTLKQDSPNKIKLLAKHQELKQKKTKRAQRLSNLQGYAARLLFRELCQVKD